MNLRGNIPMCHTGSMSSTPAAGDTIQFRHTGSTDLVTATFIRFQTKRMGGVSTTHAIVDVPGQKYRQMIFARQIVAKEAR